MYINKFENIKLLRSVLLYYIILGIMTGVGAIVKNFEDILLK